MIQHVKAHEVEGVRAPAPHARTLKHLVAPWTTGSSQLWVGLSEVDPGSSSNPHAHDNEEVFFVVAGYGRIHVEGQTVDVGPGSCVLVPGGAVHRLLNDGHEVLRVLCSVAPPFERAVFDDRHLLDNDQGEST